MELEEVVGDNEGIFRLESVENLCISEASIHFRRPAPGVEHAQTGHIPSKSRVRVDLNFS